MHTHTTLKASLHADGREVEHSRTVLCTSDLVEREAESHLGAIFAHWQERRSVSPFEVPVASGFEPQSVVPGAVDHLAVIDVSSADLAGYRAVHLGATVLGMEGFRHGASERLSPNGPHWSLLLDMAWMKEDLQPVYVETELAVDGMPSRHVSLLLPVADGEGRVTRICVATRTLLAPLQPLQEAF
jgi:hypothetical protein